MGNNIVIAGLIVQVIIFGLFVIAAAVTLASTSSPRTNATPHPGRST
jgi:hypothetical protein